MGLDDIKDSRRHSARLRRSPAKTRLNRCFCLRRDSYSRQLVLIKSNGFQQRQRVKCVDDIVEAQYTGYAVLSGDYRTFWGIMPANRFPTNTSRLQKLE